MRSCSESVYSTKVGNAEKLLMLLNESTLHLPEKCKSIIPELETTLSTVKKQNTIILIKKQQYSEAVENLKQIFIKRDDSIRKRLSGIGVYMKESFGKNSAEALLISNYITQIRGTNRVYNVGNSSIENNINQSYLSYTTQIQLFSSIIAYLETLNTYKPIDENVAVLALKAIREEAVWANDTVITTYSEFLLLKNNRAKTCIRLSKLAQEIKSSIKAVSNSRSTELRLIKSLKI